MEHKEESFDKGIDLKKLKEMQKGITSKAGGGDHLMLYANKLKEEQDVRILPALDKLNGVYFVEQEGWWINGKFFLSNSTFGAADVINEELEEAKNNPDKDVQALINKKKDSMPVIKRETRYLIPILVLDCKYDQFEELESVTVEGDEGKVLVAKPTLMKQINRVYSSKPYQNGTKHGLADRVKGFNLIVGKTGAGKETEYFAMGWNTPMEMSEEYYHKIPDVLELTQKMAKSDEFLRSVFRNYVYGDELLREEPGEEPGDEPGDEPQAKTVSKPSARPSRADIQGAVRDKDAAEAPTPSTRSKRAPEKEKAPVRAASRSLLDDAVGQLSDLD